MKLTDKITSIIVAVNNKIKKYSSVQNSVPVASDINGNLKSSNFVIADDGSINAGNLGLIVSNAHAKIGSSTINSWNSGYKVVELGNQGGAIVSSGAYGHMEVDSNCYYSDGSEFTRMSSDGASRHVQYNGEHIFKVSPSGTAGSAISFVDAMTIRNNGNVNINGKLTGSINNSSVTSVTFNADGTITIVTP